MPENNKAVGVQNLDEEFTRHRENVTKIKLEYDEAYSRLPENLSASQLEPFAKILIEREGVVLDTETCIQSIQKKLVTELTNPWNKAWEIHIAANLAKLEMLKEFFKEFEGQDWMMHEKSVEERTLPLRLEFKLKKFNWLKKMVERQEQVIKKLTEETDRERSFINAVHMESTRLDNCLKHANVEQEKKLLKKDFRELFALKKITPDDDDEFIQN